MTNSEGTNSGAGVLADSRICADVATADLDRARRFYEGVLGLRPAREAEQRGVYYRTEHGTMLNVYAITHRPSDQTVATFLVDDIEQTMSDLRARGVVFEEYDEPGLKTQDGVFSDETGFKASWFKDPDGNILSLEQLP